MDWNKKMIGLALSSKIIDQLSTLSWPHMDMLTLGSS